VDQLGALSSIFWSAGSGGIAVAGETGLAVVPPLPADPQPQGATPVQPQTVDATGPELLTGAQNAPVLSWVSGDTQIFTLAPDATTPVQQAEAAAPVTGLAVSPDGDQVAYATFDARVTVAPRAAAPGVQAAQTWETPAWLSSLSFSPDEQLIGGVDQANFTIYLLEAGSGQVQRTLAWTESPVASLYSALFSPDWSRVAWTAQTAVQVMDVASGATGALLNHEDHVSATVWSPDGSRLATAAAATVNGNLVPAVMVWDAETGERLYTLEQSTPATSLSFSPDGRQVAVLDAAGNLQVWSLEP
jgi:WD40 repeat protein